MIINNPSISEVVHKAVFNPFFLTGFADAEANFYVRISKKSAMKVGWTVEPFFSIRLHNKDLAVLNLIQNFFDGIGKVYNHEEAQEATYRVGSLKELEVIINHFDNYPLITQKFCDFILFKEIVNLVRNKEHLELEGLLKIASLKASMNTKKEVIDLPGIVPVTRPALSMDARNNIDPYWIAGFTAGDGCFSVSVIKSKAVLGETSWIRFILTQHSRDFKLMEALASYFGCGKVNQDSKAAYLVVQRLSDIKDIIIPFFDRYTLVGEKTKDYADFKSVANLMVVKAHLTKEGLETIRNIKNGMNTKRK